jgi:hypothetical protein
MRKFASFEEGKRQGVSWKLVGIQALVCVLFEGGLGNLPEMFLVKIGRLGNAQ